MEKLFCMQVAAQLTVAAAGGIGAGSTRPVDPTLQDPTQRAVDLEVWEIFRAYYYAVTQALADTASWPAPKIAQGNVVPDIITSAIQSALPALSPALMSGPLGAIINTLVKALPTPAPTPKVPGNLPNPGVTASAASAAAPTAGVPA
jgi:hypothetical protein